MSKKWWALIIIVSLIFCLGCGYFAYSYHMDKKKEKYDECIKRIESCRQDHSRGMNVACAHCCNENGEEELDGIKCLSAYTNSN